tara:strand:+ start:32 stop:418 length:387 start_codon:yes stop_codon:yes gene_type:complete
MEGEMKFLAKQQIRLTHPVMLLSEHYYRRLWLATRNICIPRREWLDELADTFRDYEGEIKTHRGLPYELPLVDDVFGDDDDMRWLGYYLKPDATGLYPNTISRKVERLQILDLYFRIKHPRIAAHFCA